MLPSFSLSLTLAQQSLLFFSFCNLLCLCSTKHAVPGSVTTGPSGDNLYQRNSVQLHEYSTQQHSCFTQMDSEWYPKRRVGGMLFPLVNQQKRRHNDLAFQFLYINLCRAMSDIAQMSDAVYNQAGNITLNKIVSLISLETVYACFRLAVFSLLHVVQTLYHQYCKVA